MLSRRCKLYYQRLQRRERDSRSYEYTKVPDSDAICTFIRAAEHDASEHGRDIGIRQRVLEIDKRFVKGSAVEINEEKAADRGHTNMFRIFESQISLLPRCYPASE